MDSAQSEAIRQAWFVAPPLLSPTNAVNNATYKDVMRAVDSTPLNDTVVQPDPNAATRPHVVARNSEPTRVKKGPPLGEILVERKTLTSDQLREAMERQRQSRKRLGEILMELGFADADSVLDGLSAQFGVPPTRVNPFTVTSEAPSYLSERVARKYSAIPEAVLQAARR